MEALRKQEEYEYTVEDILSLPDGDRAELIDGQIYYMSSPGTGHQRLLVYLCNQIYNYIEENDGECEVFAAPFAVFLNSDNRNYVEPDIAVICDKDKISEQGCDGAPDWVIEIVSPSSRSMDYYKKLFKYRTAGVREYWVVDPERKVTTVYQFEDDSMTEYAFGEEITVGIYKGFSIRV